MSLSGTSGCVLKCGRLLCLCVRQVAMSECGGWICLIVGHMTVFLSVSLSGAGGHVLECGR